MIIKKLISAAISTAIIASCAIIPTEAEDNTTEKLRVMPLGDSITDGFWLTGGYRTTLCNMLEENGCSDKIDFVGPNWGGDCYDPQHAGFSGYSIDNIEQEQSISGARTGISSFIDYLLDSYPADVIMLQIGTNDILSKYDLDNIGTRLENLVNVILDGMGSEGKLYLATIPCMDATDDLYINSYFFTPESMDESVDSYNAKIKDIAARLKAEGKNIELADINGVLTKSDLFDGVHPNADGYRKMGEFWYNTLTAYLNNEPTSPTEPTSPSESTAPSESYVPIKGDLNMDGYVNTSDLVLMQQFILKITDTLNSESQCWDINNDNILNIFDVMLLRVMIIGQYI